MVVMKKTKINNIDELKKHFICDRYHCKMAIRHCINRRAKSLAVRGCFSWHDQSCQKCEQGLKNWELKPVTNTQSKNLKYSYIDIDDNAIEKLVYNR